jgi:hypothetical protein
MFVYILLFTTFAIPKQYKSGKRIDEPHKMRYFFYL